VTPDFVRKETSVSGPTLSYLEGPTQGPPLVFLHGVSRRALSFGSHLEAFASEWHVFALDARGHGCSARAPGQYAWLDYVDDLVAFLEAQIREPAVLIGHSLGGVQALGAAAEIPRLVNGMILEDPPLYAIENTDFDFGPFPGMQKAAASGASADQIFAAWRGEPWMTEAFRRDYAESLTQLDPETLAVTADLSAPQGFDVDARLARVRCPVLLMRAGGPGAALRPRDETRALSLLPKGRSQIFEDCGHLIHAQQPDAYRCAVEQYLLSLIRF